MNMKKKITNYYTLLKCKTLRVPSVCKDITHPFYKSPIAYSPFTKDSFFTFHTCFSNIYHFYNTIKIVITSTTSYLINFEIRLENNKRGPLSPGKAGYNLTKGYVFFAVNPYPLLYINRRRSLAIGLNICTSFMLTAPFVSSAVLKKIPEKASSFSLGRDLHVEYTIINRAEGNYLITS